MAVRFGHYRPAIRRCRPRLGDLAGDLGSGLLVGVIALPLAIAFAIASGAPPAAGLITGVVAGLVIALLGGSRFQIGGPTGAFVGLCASIVGQHGLAGLALATVMAGVLLIALGVLRLGSVVRFVPAPVVTGFTTGIAAVIASTQLRDGLGIQHWPAVNPAHFPERIAAIWAGLASVNPWAVAICGATIVITVSLRKFLPRWPGALIAIVAASLLVESTGLPVSCIGDRFGTIAAGVPWPSLVPFTGLQIQGFADLRQQLLVLSGPATAIALLAAIESLLSATVADNMGRDRHDPDSELIGQGIANLVTPFFGGIPATGAIARTATSIRSGARSPLSGVIHALTLLLVMLTAMPLVAHLPLAALAGVLIVVAWYMAELHRWPQILRAGGSDAVLLLLTFGLTVAVDLTVAVEVGVLLGMFFFIRRIAASARIRRLPTSEAESEEVRALAAPSPQIEVFEISGPFFFGMAVHLRNLVHGLDRSHRVLILRLVHVPFVDATAAAALGDLISDCAAEGCQVVLSGVTDQCRADLVRHGLVARIGEARILKDFPSALAVAEDLVAATPSADAAAS